MDAFDLVPAHLATRQAAVMNALRGQGQDIGGADNIPDLGHEDGQQERRQKGQFHRIFRDGESVAGQRPPHAAHDDHVPGQARQTGRDGQDDQAVVQG